MTKYFIYASLIKLFHSFVKKRKTIIIIIMYVCCLFALKASLMVSYVFHNFVKRINGMKIHLWITAFLQPL